jgi:ABC-2 type transport system permease protein
MRNVLAIADRELRAYFISPLGFVVIALFLGVTGLFFDLLVRSYADFTMQVAMNPIYADQLNLHDALVRPLYQNFHIILLLVVPLISMRLLAEEKKQGTAELLLTAPIRTSELVVGKYMGALGFLAILMILTAQYPLFLWVSDAPPPMGAFLSVFVGTSLLAAAFLSVGLLMSSLTENQIVAGVASFVSLLILWMIGWVGEFAGERAGQILQAISLTENTEDFSRGVIDTRNIVFFVTFIGFNLFLTQRAIDSRRWR